jgi:hypothetical protein
LSLSLRFSGAEPIHADVVLSVALRGKPLLLENHPLLSLPAFTMPGRHSVFTEGLISLCMCRNFDKLGVLIELSVVESRDTSILAVAMEAIGGVHQFLKRKGLSLLSWLVEA